MPATTMNHFTVLTDDVPGTIGFYADLLGLTDGPRPPLGFPGAWLYAGDDPILHVIGGRPRDELVAGVIDHMAFSARRPRGDAREARRAQVAVPVPAAGRRRHLAGLLLRSQRRSRRARLRRGGAAARRRVVTPDAELDHLVVAAATLEQGCDWLESGLGVRPQPGGKHVAMGTHNALLRLSPTTLSSK